MKRWILVFVMCIWVLPVMAQDEVVEEPPATCTDEEITGITDALIDSEWLLDFFLVPFVATGENAEDYMPSLNGMMDVRDKWIKDVQPSLPNCVESLEFQQLMGDYLDAIAIRLMSTVIGIEVDETYTDRAEIEQTRIIASEAELTSHFEILFADIDIDTLMQDQMAARESGD